jgi:hypothetical protein
MNLENRITQEAMDVADVIEILDIPLSGIFYASWHCGHCGYGNADKVQLIPFPIVSCDECKHPNVMPLPFKEYIN